MSDANDLARRLVIKWRKKLELGIPHVDRQHKRLVELTNDFYNQILWEEKKARQAAVQENSQEKGWWVALSFALRETAEYAATHFADEEKIMQAVNFPGYAEHKKKHEDFTEKVAQFIADFKNAQIETAFEFAKFLYEWITNHIVAEDTAYVKYIVEYKQLRQTDIGT